MSKKFKPKRNDPCPCGSGKKYKKCHYLLIENFRDRRLREYKEAIHRAKERRKTRALNELSDSLRRENE